MTILGGILLPSDVLHSGWFQALAAFVAMNTLIYASLSLAKLIPRRRALITALSRSPRVDHRCEPRVVSARKDGPKACLDTGAVVVAARATRSGCAQHVLAAPDQH